MKVQQALELEEHYCACSWRTPGRHATCTPQFRGTRGRRLEESSEDPSVHFGVLGGYCESRTVSLRGNALIRTPKVVPRKVSPACTCKMALRLP